MVCFSTMRTAPASDQPAREPGLEHPRISTGVVLIGSLGVLSCASVIVSLLMAG